jgi:hypothetical protein
MSSRLREGNRERSDQSPRFDTEARAGVPFTVRRIVLIDSDGRRALADLGEAGSGWVSFDYPIGSPVWRGLDPDDFVKLHLAMRAVGPRERR